MFPPRPLPEQFYLWNLCGADVSTLLVQKGELRKKAPVRAVPTLVVDDFRQFGNQEMRRVEVNTGVVPLPCKNLNQVSCFLMSWFRCLGVLEVNECVRKS